MEQKVGKFGETCRRFLIRDIGGSKPRSDSEAPSAVELTLWSGADSPGYIKPLPFVFLGVHSWFAPGEAIALPLITTVHHLTDLRHLRLFAANPGIAARRLK